MSPDVASVFRGGGEEKTSKTMLPGSLCLFIRKAKAFPRVSQQPVSISAVRTGSTWLHLAAREVVRNMEHGREKVGKSDPGKHAHGIRHSPF